MLLPASADVPLATIMIAYPVMDVMIAPIIFIEALVCVPFLELRWGESLKTSLIAKMISIVSVSPVTHVIFGIPFLYYMALQQNSLSYLR